MMKKWLAAGALALTASMATTASYAQTTTVPGEQVGLATGAPLPEGVYAVNTFLYRSIDNSAIDVGVNIPILLWSTPFVPLGGRIELAVAPPTVFVFGNRGGPTGIRDLSINVGTFVGGIWAFDLGGNVGVSLLGGVYLNELNGDRGVLVQNNGVFAGAPVLPQLASNTYRVGGAISYTGDNWNLTANLTYNFYDSPATFSGGVSPTRGPFVLSDALNLDLTATKKFDLFNEGKAKFEFGLVAYGTYTLGATNFNTWNVHVPSGGYFNVGGLVGYDFGPFTAQAYVTRTVARSTGLSDTTEGWLRLIVPLWSPPAAPPPAPIITKY